MGRAVACCPPHSALFSPDKNLVSESPDETKTPAARLAAQRRPPGSAPQAPGCLPATLCPGQRPAAAVPLGIPSWALLGPPTSGACLRGLSVGPGRAASAVLPPRPWEPGANAEPGPVCPAGDQGYLLRDTWQPRSLQLVSRAGRLPGQTDIPHVHRRHPNILAGAWRRSPWDPRPWLWRRVCSCPFGKPKARSGLVPHWASSVW